MREPSISKTEVMDLTTICQSFPRLPRKIIPRENVIDAVERMFDGGIELVTIEGEEGLGKTTLLAQFAKCHPNNTFSVFIRPPSRLSSDPASIRFDLCSQILWFLRRDESCTPEQADDGYFRSRLLELRKRARHENFYFVLDGLADVIDEGTQRIIFDSFPLGQGFKFLFSGNLNELPISSHSRKAIECKSFPMVKFTIDETQKFFEDLQLEPSTLEDLYRACGRGIPGYLASARRSIVAGEDPNDLATTAIEDLFESEWKQVSIDESALLPLAILTHAQHHIKLEELARLLGKDSDEIGSIISGLTFLQMDENTFEISFVSELFRAFATGKLGDRREEVMDLIIDDLQSRHDTDVSISYLPDYLEQRGKLDGVLECLSQEYFEQIVNQSESLVAVRQKVDLGISSALKLKSYHQLVRFSMQRSAIAQIEEDEIWRSEVEALMALDDFNGAMNLAQSTLLKEDRLHLFAVIAKERREKGRLIEDELLQQIRTLYQQVDAVSLGNRAVDIASDLYISCPDLAIDLIEQSAGIESEGNALDLAYAKLSISAFRSRSLDDGPEDGMEEIRDRIKNPDLRNLSAALLSPIRNQTCQEVIAEANKMGSVDYRLQVLRKWAVKNRYREDAGDVIEYAIDQALKTSTYSPNARVLRELAAPLPYLQDKSRVRHLVGIFDSQKATVEGIGPTEDYIRLQLLLARAEEFYNIDACRTRVVDIYFSIGSLDDPALRASCFAWLLAALNRISLGKDFEAKEGIRELTISDIKSTVGLLLQDTAEHFDLMRGTIRALALSDPDMGLELALGLNTERRRDLAIGSLIDSLVSTDLARINTTVLEKALASFVDQDERDESLTKFIERYAKEFDITKPLAKSVFPFIGKISTIRGARQRCRACCAAHTLLCSADEAGEHQELKKHLLEILSDSWKKIDSGWAVVDSGFQIAKSLADHRIDLARQYFRDTESERDQLIFNAEGTARTYMVCLRLVIRSFSGLLPKNIDVEQDHVRVGELIDCLPSRGERAQLWAELAIRCFIASRTDKGQAIMTERVKPLLAEISGMDQSYYVSTMLKVSEALYKAHPPTAMELIRTLPQPDRNEAFSRIAAFLLRNKPLTDPYDSAGHEYDLSYETIVEILNVINEIESDATVYHSVQSICSTLSSPRSRNLVTTQQKAEIIRRIREIASSKFPDPKNIKHEGFKIAAEGQIARLEDAPSHIWDGLLDRARAIPNVSDSSYVIALLAAAMPNRVDDKRRKASEEAIRIVERVPSVYDRIDRTVDVASVISTVDQKEAERYLKSAMESINKQNMPGLGALRKRIIDLTFRLDPDLAASLASLADDDPAKKAARMDQKDRLETLKLSKRIMNNELNSEESKPSHHKSELPKSAWLALGSLNGGRAATLRLEDTTEHLRLAADYPIGDAYPILSWVIENAVKRFSGTDQASTVLREMFEATLLGTEMASRMAAQYSNQLKRTKGRMAQSETTNQILLRAGDRDKAVHFIRDWLANEAKEYIKICDQYFGPADLELLSLIRSAIPECSVQVLTSKKHHDQLGVVDLPDEYLKEWRKGSDQDPPVTDIVVVGLESTGRSPIHDRWWLTKGSGLKIGTSFNSIGSTQDSTISVISQEEATSLEIELDQYLVEKRRDYNGERLRYLSFTL